VFIRFCTCRPDISLIVSSNVGHIAKNYF